MEEPSARSAAERECWIIGFVLRELDEAAARDLAGECLAALCGSAYPAEHYIGLWRSGQLPDEPRPARTDGH